MARESPHLQRRRRSRWGPRRSLAVAIAASIAIALTTGYFMLNREFPDRGLTARLTAAIACSLSFLALAFWLPRIVTGRGPGRTLVAVLAADAMLVGLAFIAFAGWLTPAAYAVAATGGVAAGIAVFWWFPRWQAQQWPQDIVGSDRIELEDKTRATVAQLLSGLGLIATVAITLYSVNEGRITANHTLELAERQQSTDRFSRAVNQLDARSGKQRATAIRVGGIYALKQYALQTPKGPDEAIDIRSTVVTILAAYIRTNARATRVVREKPPPPVPANCAAGSRHQLAQRSLAPDIAAALEVLRDFYGPSHEDWPRDVPAVFLPRIDFSGADLRGADLTKMYLAYSNLEHAVIAGADLEDSNLDTADLTDADARNSCFYTSRPDNTTKDGAIFTGAIICARDGGSPTGWVRRGARCPG